MLRVLDVEISALHFVPANIQVLEGSMPVSRAVANDLAKFL